MMACTKRAVKVVGQRPFRRAAAIASLAMMGSASAADNLPWPQIPLPEQVAAFDIGDEMVVNGMPIRARGFVSRASPAELAKAMRRLLGAPLMEDRHGATLVLGRAKGMYYVTVQLTPLGAGTRAVIAVTRPPVGERAPDDTAARRLLSRLPPGSTLASHSSSVDGTNRAEQAAIVNSHSTSINAEYVKRMLRAEGYTLEREAAPTQPTRTQGSSGRDATTMFFKRPGAEAIAVVTRDKSGNSVIVLNRVNSGGINK